MPEKQAKLYILFTVLILVGYLWIGNVYLSWNDNAVTVCPIKLSTNYPCPSCGSTRAVYKLIQGDVMEGVRINPIGLIIGFILLIAPVWMLYDVISKSSSLIKAYEKTEKLIRKKQVALPLILLVLANWIWNITKGL